jgi:hypothetical protein
MLAQASLTIHQKMPQPAIVLPVLVAVLAYFVSLHDSVLTGRLYYEELMQTPNSERFLHAARMDLLVLDEEF